jgi:hypothetical protein
VLWAGYRGKPMIELPARVAQPEPLTFIIKKNNEYGRSKGHFHLFLTIHPSVVAVCAWR